MRKTSWTPFWKIFPLLALVPIAILVLVYNRHMANFQAELAHEGQLSIEAQIEAITLRFDRLIADVHCLTQQRELVEFIESRDRTWLPLITQEYLTLSRYTKIYDQIRYLDEHGREVVRVNYNNGQPASVPESELQDKSDRYYFKDTIALSPGQIYMSPLDLNIENGAIERPFKPMVRIGSPVFDRHGQRRGIVIVNFLAQTLLSAVERAGKSAFGDPMLLNSDGYWLLSPNPPPSWGFMFPEQTEMRLQTLYPDVWKAMSQSPSGSVETGQGVFFFQLLDPLSDQTSSASSIADNHAQYPHRWWVVSHVSQARINVVQRRILTWLFVTGVTVLLLLAFATRAISVVLSERKRHHAHLEHLALVDALTGIPNRAAFEERLELEFERATRHDRPLALLYIDLDGFKAINDTQGHQRGDQVLKDVATCLATHCRREDMVSRFGGDEFAILIAEPPNIATAMDIAEKVRKRVAALDWDGQSVSASIGVALYPDHALNLLELIRAADTAMYDSKTSGKNCISLPSCLP